MTGSSDFLLFLLKKIGFKGRLNSPSDLEQFWLYLSTTPYALWNDYSNLCYESNRKPKSRVTPSELCWTMFRAELEPLMNETSNLCVVAQVFDDERNLPHQKDRECQKRYQQRKKKQQELEESGDSSSSSLPYPHNIKIVEDGIWNPETEQIETIDSNRFMRSKSHRRMFLGWCCQHIASTYCPRFRDNATFWLDFEECGPHEFTRLHGHRHRLDLNHNHGESDPALAWWAFQYPELVHVFQSKDADLFPITSLLMTQVSFSSLYPGRYFWYAKSKVAHVLDMFVVTQSLEREIKWSPNTIAIAYALVKSDYTEKAEYAHRMSFLDIMQAVSEAEEVKNEPLYMIEWKQARERVERIFEHLYLERLCPRQERKVIVGPYAPSPPQEMTNLELKWNMDRPSHTLCLPIGTRRVPLNILEKWRIASGSQAVFASKEILDQLTDDLRWIIQNWTDQVGRVHKCLPPNHLTCS